MSLCIRRRCDQAVLPLADDGRVVVVVVAVMVVAVVVVAVVVAAVVEHPPSCMQFKRVSNFFGPSSPSALLLQPNYNEAWW